MDFVLKIIVNDYDYSSTTYSKIENIIFQLNNAVFTYLQEKYMNTSLKVQAITQLGYSRGGTNNSLPDDIVNQIKSFIFYDFTNKEIQQKHALTIFGEHELKLLMNWAHCRIYCDCHVCFQHCVLFLHELIYNNIVEYVKNK